MLKLPKSSFQSEKKGVKPKDHKNNRPPARMLCKGALHQKSLLKSKSFGKPAPTHNPINLIHAEGLMETILAHREASLHFGGIDAQRLINVIACKRYYDCFCKPKDILC